MSSFPLKASLKVILLGILVVVFGFQSVSLAKMEYVNGKDSIEGDPGDGLETIGGSSGGYYVEDGQLASTTIRTSTDGYFTLLGVGDNLILAIVPLEIDGVIRFVLVPQYLGTDWGRK